MVKRQFERPRHRWEDDIKTGVKYIQDATVDCLDVVQGSDKWWAVVNAVMNLRIP